MRAFVTGATGFIGGHVVRKLRARGDDVVALVRSPEKAADLRALGCDLATGDLVAVDAIQQGVRDCDAVFHIAAVYEVGITAQECADMHRSNVDGTRMIFDAAADAEVSKVVYVSTINYFGNTGGRVMKEGEARPSMEFLSCYDETKYLAHELAVDRMAKGAPIVIVQPGSVYGPGDQSQVGRQIDDARRGRAKLMIFPDLGLNMVHVDDVADGILLGHDRGKVGETYVLGGHIGTMGELVQTVARLSGHKPPTLSLPAALIRASIPLAPVITRVMGFPPNLRELVKASDGVTYWATDDKARRELGYAPRDFETGLREMLDAL
jgi:dihydroflavonol-4-reductase